MMALAMLPPPMKAMGGRGDALAVMGWGGEAMRSGGIVRRPASFRVIQKQELLALATQEVQGVLYLKMGCSKRQQLWFLRQPGSTACATACSQRAINASAWLRG
ncbi:MAG: hypothetical protein E7K47_04150, partial [Acidovorax sp.]|nr:hypothetical protein [Acidovorax sp.]